MKIEEHIDHFVDCEKKTEANPFLSSRVMAKIENLNKIAFAPTTKFQKLAFAASIAAVAIIGINIGKIYTPTNTGEEISLNIDDMKMENLTIYNFNDYAN